MYCVEPMMTDKIFAIFNFDVEVSEYVFDPNKRTTQSFVFEDVLKSTQASVPVHVQSKDLSNKHLSILML